VLKIEDPAFVAMSGKAYHAIVKFNGRTDSRVSGMVAAFAPTILS
jgi:hypothetical protein